MAELTILHVEDDTNDALLLQHACQRAGLGCCFKVAVDGEHAMRYLRGEGEFSDRNSHPLPDLVLLDLKMPRVNGFELLQWIRKRSELTHLPVVVLTSSNHEGDIQRAYDAGANSYLVKPVDFNALIEMIKSVHQYWLRLNHPPPRRNGNGG